MGRDGGDAYDQDHRPSGHGGNQHSTTALRDLTMFDPTYLAGLGDTALGQSSLDWLQVGTCLPLHRVQRTPGGRRARTWHSEVEVQAPDGRALGYLPSYDSEAVAEAIDAGLPATARVTALVPSRHRPRVHLAIEVGRATAGSHRA